MRDHHNPRTKRTKRIVPVADLIAMARGRWPEILTDAGMPAEVLADRRGRPCPRCGGRDRFSVLPDFPARGAMMCRHCFHRGTEPRPGDGLASLRWWLGVTVAEAARWLAAWLGVGPADAHPSRRPIERRLSIPDAERRSVDRFAEMADRWFRAMRPAWLCRAADLLGLPADPLVRLRAGWAEPHRATSWPMRDAAGRVVGVRLRCPETAKKWAVTGSRAGLFIPAGLACEGRRLFVAEGPTDTAALLSIDLPAVGVPSAGGAADLLARLVRDRAPSDLVVLADADGPGRDGAERLAEALLPVRPVRVLSPSDGAKDARAWVVQGVGRDEIERAAEAAPVRSMQVRRAHR
jgi:phage/plasmid primase-like uncharacterized protein